MKNRSTRQTLAEDIKREVLLDLNRNRIMGGTDRDLVENIKREVMVELEQPRYNPHYPDRQFMEAIKNEVLNQIRYEIRPSAEAVGKANYPSRATIESLKREIIAQIETEQEAQEESATPGRYQRTSDPALIQAIKNSILAEMSIHPVQ